MVHSPFGAGDRLRLHRAPSRVSREITRNGGPGLVPCAYRRSASVASSARPKACKLARTRIWGESWPRKLRHDWSPQQIAGWLKSAHPDDEALRVSHETIYRTLFVQTRGVLKKELVDICGRILRSAAQVTPRQRPIDEGRSWTRSRSGSGQRASRIERFPATGRVICCAARRTATSSRWSNATAAT